MMIYASKGIYNINQNNLYNINYIDPIIQLSFSDVPKIKRWSKKQLHFSCEQKGEENRYSLASAITIQVCSPNTNNLRLNELGRLAAEITSMVPIIASDWLGILQAIMPKEGSKGYNDVCTRIDGVSPITLAEQLAVLYGIMMARGAIQMKSVVAIVLSSLQYNYNKAKIHSDPKQAQRTRDAVRCSCAFLLIILRSKPHKGIEYIPNTIVYRLYSIVYTVYIYIYMKSNFDFRFSDRDDRSSFIERCSVFVRMFPFGPDIKDFNVNFF